MKKIFICIISCGLITITSCEQGKKEENAMSTQDSLAMDDQKDSTDEGDDIKEFIDDESQDGMMEVKLGELAHTQGTSKIVKDLGHHMVMDHTKANEELKKIASSKNIILSDSLKDKKLERISELAELKGKDFDEKYIKMMVKEHKEDVEDFEEASNEIKDPALNAFAVKTLPVLKMHLKMSQEADSLLNLPKK